jgi:hypothetical protein
MPFARAAVNERIRKFDFAGLFTQELGWDLHKGSLTAHLPDRDVVLNAVAEKRGFAVWHCPTLPDQKLPDSAIRRRIERELTKAAHEHILIFSDTAKSIQVWQWVRREAGKPTRVRETVWTKDQSGEILVQKLERLFISLDEEERLTLPDVTSRAAGNVDERVTKRFYEEFRKQHGVFLKFITGIPNQGDHEWYASVMLNRLMFLYFIQRKGFLDGDPDYLRNRLRKMKAEHGKDKFYSFYRYFLLKLFHGGLNARPPRQAALEKLLGRVPYLNGGIFDIHQLERTKAEGGYGPDIQMPDKAFETIFDYFDRYQWHLDERPLRADNEINPDVLGYIFEKYVNQKQMGAYYTKEDITDYIGKNTILPFLFDSARQRCNSAFDGPNSVWAHLQQEPDRYIYPAVRHGIFWSYIPGHPNLGEPLGKPRELPAEIAKGLDTSKPNLIERRKAWNKPAPPEFGLPTEIWRETVARRQRFEELRAKLAAGEVHDINDFITLNLDIRRFGQDVISRCDSPDLLAAFWHSLAGRPPRKSDERPQHGITILDPTCGSGAFLFAALNILEPLYEACLDRMEGLLADARIAKGVDWKPPLYSHLAEFERVLSSVADHPNERYFIYKTIILHNLYGVDLMEEAVEICKLRLFLKLAAQVEPDSDDKNLGIEPLPDIDFNIRAGNTLVGYATRAELEAVGRGDMMLQLEVGKVLEAAEDAAAAYDTFVRSQLDGEDPAEFKRRLLEKFGHAREQCDRFLAESYFGGKPKQQQFAAWKQSHAPFHWFVEFFGILSKGGFDVIIGNPPYVELSDIAGQYSVRHSALIETGNLYALCMERFAHLLHGAARIGVIVPISSVSTPRMLPLMHFMHRSSPLLHLSNFAVRPGKLFVGVDMNLTIFIGKRGSQAASAGLFSTGYNRWSEQARSTLFSTLSYAETELIANASAIPKTGTEYTLHILQKIRKHPSFARRRSDSPGATRVFYHSGGRYFRKCIREQLSNEYKPLNLEKGFADAAICLLSSSLYYWFWIAFSDCYHVTKGDIDAMPVPDSIVANPEFTSLATRLLEDLWLHAERRIRNRKDGSQQEEVNFHVGMSKPIIDEIDSILAKHYGLSPDELDFIANYDAKYRFVDNGGDEE